MFLKINKPQKGFTLIELLIVVAIIGILAAIAIPNFLEAQVRAKVARVQSDMRSMSLAMEMYFIDHNDYPPWLSPCNPNWHYQRLTTPVAYITRTFEDIFMSPAHPSSCDVLDYMLERDNWWGDLEYLPTGAAVRTGKLRNNEMIETNVEVDGLNPIWYIGSVGPDSLWEGTLANAERRQRLMYDPTNGTVSVGDIIRLGP